MKTHLYSHVSEEEQPRQTEQSRPGPRSMFAGFEKGTEACDPGVE